MAQGFPEDPHFIHVVSSSGSAGFFDSFVLSEPARLKASKAEPRLLSYGFILFQSQRRRLLVRLIESFEFAVSTS